MLDRGRLPAAVHQGRVAGAAGAHRGARACTITLVSPGHLIGRQVHLEIGDQDFYADLLFYHLRLRAFVIELKATDFEPGYLGQLGMYMAAVDDLLAHADDKPSIGLLLCRTKNKVVAEYALRGFTMPIGIAE